MYKKIYLDAPCVGSLEKKYLNSAIDKGYVSTIGHYVCQFEKIFADYLGVKKSVSTQSGTASIYMVLYELGIGYGDEVIAPALTFAATVNPILYLGATPVIVDVDKSTWNISLSEIERNITKKTKAIIPVHLYGNPCDMEAILNIAKRYNLYVIEDATESLGAVYKKKHTGTFGNFGCFSFNGNKIITTGGGGMVVGRKEKNLEHIKFLINQAKSLENSAYHPEIGFNYRMTNIEAALGLAQMQKLEDFLKKKRKFRNIYQDKLKTVKGISFQQEYQKAESSYWFTGIIFDRGIDVSCLQDRLHRKGIPTRRFFSPLVEFPPYKKFRRSDCKNSYHIYRKGLCLPSSTLNSEKDISNVCEVMKRLLN